jgi:hypothetical protein
VCYANGQPLCRRKPKPGMMIWKCTTLYRVVVVVVLVIVETAADAVVVKAMVWNENRFITL